LRCEPSASEDNGVATAPIPFPKELSSPDIPDRPSADAAFTRGSHLKWCSYRRGIPSTGA